MRKIRLFAVAAGSCCALFGAAGAEAPKLSVSPDKVLVVYYSWGGNTKVAAEEIARAAGAKCFAIRPKKAYPQDYRTCVKQAKNECANGTMPELAAWPDDLTRYDVIFVGSPNWWGTMAPPLRTFLSSPALVGKTIIPFFTNGGGGMQNCERDVRKVCSRSKVIAGDSFYGTTVKMNKSKYTSFVKERVNIVK